MFCHIATFVIWLVKNEKKLDVAKVFDCIWILFYKNFDVYPQSNLKSAFRYYS